VVESGERFYLLLVEMQKAQQTQMTQTMNLLTEVKGLVSQVSERLARLESQALPEKIAELDRELRVNKEILTSMQLQPNVTALDNRRRIELLEKEVLESRTKMKVITTIGFTLMTVLVPIIGILVNNFLGKS